MSKRVLSIFLICILCLYSIPIPVYAAGSGFTSLRSNQDLESAVDKASKGEVIDLGNNSFLINDTESDSAPWDILKEVTIQNGTIELRAGGIVLGANVTFKNIKLNFPNTARNVIAANGYTLTLENTTRAKTDSGTNLAQQVHLVCGTMVSADGKIASTTIPKSGSHGVITIIGNNVDLGNIYAGNFYTDSTASVSSIPATINIQATGNLGMEYDGNLYGSTSSVAIKKGIYASGAGQTRSPGLTLDTSYIQCPPLPLENGFSGGIMEADVKVNLGDGNVKLSTSNVPTIYGNTGGSGKTKVTLTDDSTNSYSLSLPMKDISELSLSPVSGASTNFVFGGDSSITKGGKLTVPSNTILDFTNLQEDEVLEVSSFSGGGKLILKAYQALSVTGSVNGKTEVAIGGLAYNGSSTASPYKGHTYISANLQQPDDSFILIPSDQDSTLTFSRKDDGGWWIPSDQQVDGLKASNFEFDLNSPLVENSGVNSINLPVHVEYVGNSGWPSIIDLHPSITVNGEAASVGGDEYSVTYTVRDIWLSFSEGDYSSPGNSGNDYGEYLIIGANSGSLQDGQYRIKVTLPSESMVDGNSLSREMVVTVGETTPVKPVITIDTQPQDRSVTQGSITEKLSVQASVSDGGSLIYQWYGCDENGGNEKEISGNNTMEFTIPQDLGQGVYHYFCRISASGADSVDTDVVKVTVAAQPVELERIEITTTPTKLEYTAGESFDPSGMEVTAYYSDSSKKVIGAYKISPEGSLQPENTVITITYEEKGISKQTTQSIRVKEEIEELQSLSSLSEITGIQNGTALTEIKLPDSIGIITSKGEKRARISWNIAGANYDPGVETEQTITIVGTVELPSGIVNTTNLSLEVEQKIKVMAKEKAEVTAISMKTTPDKITYTEGEKLNLEGLVVSLKKSDGSTQEVEWKKFEEYGIQTQPQAGAELSIRDDEVSVFVDSYSVSFSITVEESKQHNHSLEYKYLDDSGHWKECSDQSCPDEHKGKTVIESHQWESDMDADCDCGYTRTIETGGDSSKEDGMNPPTGEDNPSTGGDNQGQKPPTQGGENQEENPPAGDGNQEDNPSTGGDNQGQKPPTQGGENQEENPSTGGNNQGGNNQGGNPPASENHQGQNSSPENQNPSLENGQNSESPSNGRIDLHQQNIGIENISGETVLNQGEDSSLLIPAYVDYTVKKGDTLRKIAKKYECTIADIMSVNRELIKNPNIIRVGWIIKIPNKKTVEELADLTNGGKVLTYVIRSGDTLSGIARKYGCTISDIISLNTDKIKNPNLILVGWEIKIGKE